jgi:hypothetical protein
VVIVLFDNDLIVTKTTSDDEIADSLIGSKNTVDENSDIDVEDAVFNNLTYNKDGLCWTRSCELYTGNT